MDIRAQIQAPNPLSGGLEPPVSLERELCGPRGTLIDVEKGKFSPQEDSNLGPSDIQLAASCYIHYIRNLGSCTYVQMECSMNLTNFLTTAAAAGSSLIL